MYGKILNHLYRTFRFLIWFATHLYQRKTWKQQWQKCTQISQISEKWRRFRGGLLDRRGFQRSDGPGAAALGVSGPVRWDLLLHLAARGAIRTGVSLWPAADLWSHQASGVRDFRKSWVCYVCWFIKPIEYRYLEKRPSYICSEPIELMLNPSCLILTEKKGLKDWKNVFAAFCWVYPVCPTFC